MTRTDHTIDIFVQRVRFKYLLNLGSNFVTVQSLHPGLPIFPDLLCPWSIYDHPHTYSCDGSSMLESRGGS